MAYNGKLSQYYKACTCLVCNIATLPQSLNFKLSAELLYKLSLKDTIGIRLRKLRKIKGITAKQLSNIIGISPEGVINYENDNAYPSRNVLLKLKTIFNDDILCDAYSKFITSDYRSSLKTWRKNNNLRYKDAAEYLKMSQTTYYNFENMVYIITPKHFENYKNKILKVLK